MNIVERWEEQLAGVVAWVRERQQDAGSTRTHYAHLRGQPVSGMTMTAPFVLWSMITEHSPDTMVCHVMGNPDIEWLAGVHMPNEAEELIEAAMQREAPPMSQLTRMDYRRAIYAARRNLAQPELSDAPLQGEVEIDSLHRKAVVIIEVDFRLETEMCLALVALQTWAHELLRRHAAARTASVSFILMSSGRLPVALRRACAVRQRQTMTLPRIPTFVVEHSARPAWEQAQVHSGTDAELVSCLEQNLQAAGQRHHLILSFDVFTLPGLLHQRGMDFVGVTSADAEHHLDVLANEGAIPSLVSINPTIKAPMRITGPEELHIFLLDVWDRNVLDHRTGQIMELSTVLSVEKCRHQLTWADRVEVPPSRVHFYVGSRSIQDFLEEAPSRVRTLIENSEVSGFVTALTEFTDGNDELTSRYLRCFITEPSTLAETVVRLRRQGIIRNPPGEISMPRFRLTGQRASVFRASLPHVKYDARLALLISLPSPSPAVTSARLQLAAILTANPEEVFPLHNMNQAEPGKPIPFLNGACDGMAKPYTHEGSIWLWLALWNATLSKVIDGIAPPDRQGKIHIQTSELRVPVNWAAFGHAVWAMRRLQTVLDALGVETLEATVISEFSQEEKDVFTRDLLKVFKAQLTTASPFSHFTDLTSRDPMLGLGMLLWSAGDIDSTFFEPGWGSGSNVYGISLFRRRRDSSAPTQLRDWTWIAADMVEEWAQEHYPIRGLEAGLQATGPFSYNPDEAVVDDGSVAEDE